MTPSWTLAAVAFAVVLEQADHSARADQLSLRNGAYEVTARLELPHLERWAVDRTTTICVRSAASEGEIPVPVLSTNNPFAECSTANLMMDGATLQYDIICPGRGAARAHAIYTLAPGRFAGRIAMVMGAKNMTMIEVQHARRLGDCPPAVADSAARF
jgi:hypothetical protein